GRSADTEAGQSIHCVRYDRASNACGWCCCGAVFSDGPIQCDDAHGADCNTTERFLPDNP
ncbi:hypothetical protein, partial [Acetobacter sicerae]|uniref:hypothetical protein n=1 Tax=Acetobacter sicerae TaxID=85325 RepID=UPI001A7EC6F3